MKAFAQPESYSDMLQRVFYFTVASGFVCTVLLALGSPQLKAFLDSLDVEASIGPIGGLKALYVVVPLAVGLVSRMLKIHDMLSSLFRIRFRFDTLRFLVPLATGAGINVTPEIKRRVRSNRAAAMYKVFYPYASFKDPKIDAQLVRTAADYWGWFWVLLESSLLFSITSCVLGALAQSLLCIVSAAVVLGELLLLLFMWTGCKRTAARQVNAILAQPGWKQEIFDYFSTL